MGRTEREPGAGGPVEAELLGLPREFAVMGVPFVRHGLGNTSSMRRSRGGHAAQMRRRRRPGVTAAETTGVLATGARPCVTALVTTAVLAPGCPTTPTRTTLASPSGRSGSCCFLCRFSLVCCDD